MLEPYACMWNEHVNSKHHLASFAATGNNYSSDVDVGSTDSLSVAGLGTVRDFDRRKRRK